jgi:putative transposase
MEGFFHSQLERLSDLFVRKGVPVHIGSDNGSEFTATRLREWLEWVGMKPPHLEPRSPWENGYVESFNGKLPHELLARGVFDTLLEAKVPIERCRGAHNTVRPHSSLGTGSGPRSRTAPTACFATPQQADRDEPLAGQP